MDRFLSLIPKNLLAFLAIAGGMAFIIMSQPPHSLCDSQLEVIDSAQRRFLYKDPQSKKIVTTKYELLRDHCKRTNDPGGCYELFQEIKIMNHDLGMLTSECQPVVADIKEYKRAMWETVETLVRLAWGESPPASYTSKFGWLDSADLSLFCNLKDRIVAAYGEDQWDSFRERMMSELPGTKDLPRNQVWDLSIFSENCARYP
jgi:hypothetical protein